MVKVLNLSGCRIKDSGARLLSSVLRDTETIEQVNLSDCAISDEGTRTLCDALKLQETVVLLGMLYV